MKGEWHVIPTQEDGAALETTSDRVRAACRIVGMTLLGLSIGCAFVAIRWLVGIEA